MLILRLNLGFSPRGHPRCHTFFSPKIFPKSQPTYLLLSLPQKPFKVSHIASKKNFSKKISIIKFGLYISYKYFSLYVLDKNTPPPLSFSTSFKVSIKKFFSRNFRSRNWVFLYIYQ